MNQLSSLLKTSKLLKNQSYKRSLVSVILMAAMSVQAAPTVTATDPVATPPVAGQTNSSQSLPYSTLNATMPATNTLAAQLQPSNKALSAANQDLLSRNAQLQRQVNDLQTQTNVLVYESKGQLFLYGAFTVLISLLVGIFISWLVFVRRERW
ncbi:hypothetical protein [Psychrobacter sp. LV10R520-6]|uniref:hypothetical protein n=1 Tax=Psychrobacter sp. LV10R520-6 TaxID=1415574 RepID=UPI0024C67B72|nr:hypothetical protein [Psychrobacter sp. LV10R520-6]SNT70510.1 hypothetical protein SAMN04488491_1684 [Psychrobacter sp. LV10R520-6]